MDAVSDWAEEVFGDAELGDIRRTRRLVRMAAAAGRSPSGRLSDVYDSAAERQGAYDFIESEHVKTRRICDSIVTSTARNCAAHDWVYVPVDGTSIKLLDGTGGHKNFGSIGTYHKGALGLKLNNALAVAADGVPIGVAAQVWWRRPRRRPKERRPCFLRHLEDKETQFLLDCIDQVTETFAKHAPKTKCWFQMDRGCDAQYVLLHLAATGHDFTVRSQSKRRMLSADGRKLWLKNHLRRQPALGQFSIDLPKTESRAARRATMVVRAKIVTLRLRDKWSKRCFALPVSAVLVQELSHRGDRIDWLLLTSQPAATFEQAMRVVHGYTQRWRIEEFHKTLKTGACNVEETQLHSSERVIRWATVLSAVATRVERLKYLARSSPDLPALQELTETELRALILLKRRRKKANEVLPANPTISDATRWIAELGGYTGKSSGGPPGTITIARGLEKLAIAAELLASTSKMR
jgi:hypothetical protein